MSLTTPFEGPRTMHPRSETRKEEQRGEKNGAGCIASTVIIKHSPSNLQQVILIIKRERERATKACPSLPNPSMEGETTTTTPLCPSRRLFRQQHRHLHPMSLQQQLHQHLFFPRLLLEINTWLDETTTTTTRTMTWNHHRSSACAAFVWKATTIMTMT